MRPNLQLIFQSSFQDEKGGYLNVLSENDIQLIFQNKLFKCFLPTHLGGLNLSIKETLQVIEEVSYINGSLGWLIQIGNGGNYFVTNFETNKAQELFSPSNAVIAGSGTPTSIAKRVDGGYLVSGKWRFCSGSEYATLFTITFKIEGTEEVMSAVVQRENVKIINDWKTFGLKKTSTNSIELTDVFVPEDTLFTVMKRKSYFDDPIYDLPFLVYAQAFFLQVVYGTFRKMIVSYRTQLENEGVYQERHSEKQLKAEKILLNAEELLVSSKDELDEIVSMLIAKKEVDIVDKQQCLINQALKIKDFANQLFTMRGIEALYESNPFTVAYLDLLTVSQHKLLNEIV